MPEYSIPPRDLQTAEWADFDGEALTVSGEEREIKMMNSDGTGSPLLKNGQLGADVIRFGAGEGVAEHTHIGQHVLFVLRGEGIVKYDGVNNDLYPGKCYLVESWVPHAIYASKIGALVLLVVGDDHRGLNDPSRMELTENGQIEIANKVAVEPNDVIDASKVLEEKGPEAYLD